MQPRRLSTNMGYQSRGALQHRVILLKQGTGRTAEGEFSDATDFADTWASIWLLQGRELDRAQQIVAEATHKIIIPYQDGIESEMMVSFRGRVFVIQAVADPDERQVELHLFCIERNEGKDEA